MIQVKKYATMNGRHEVWLARWYVDGHRGSRTLGKVADMSEDQAEDARDKLEFELRTGDQPAIKPEGGTLGEFLLWRMDIAADARSATRREYKVSLNHLISVVGANTQVRSINRTHMRQLQTKMRKDGMSKSTITKVLNSLRATWYVALGDNLVATNPFTKHGSTSEAKAQRIYSSDEIAVLVQACPTDWWTTFLRLLATSGLRKTEALRLQWRHVDFEAGTVTVARQDPGTFKVNGKSYPLLAWRAKAKESYRSIPLPPETMIQLRRWRLKSGPSEYIFVGLDRLVLADRLLQAGKLDDDYPMVTNMTRSFRHIQLRARKIMADIRKVPVGQIHWVNGTLHDFRDSYLTSCKHLPIDVLKRIAGHSTLATTLKYYVSERPEDAVAVREAVKAAGLAG